jgi:hypothetical protein
MLVKPVDLIVSASITTKVCQSVHSRELDQATDQTIRHSDTRLTVWNAGETCLSHSQSFDDCKGLSANPQSWIIYLTVVYFTLLQ